MPAADAQLGATELQIIRTLAPFAQPTAIALAMGLPRTTVTDAMLRHQILGRRIVDQDTCKVVVEAIRTGQHPDMKSLILREATGPRDGLPWTYAEVSRIQEFAGLIATSKMAQFLGRNAAAIKDEMIRQGCWGQHTQYSTENCVKILKRRTGFSVSSRQIRKWLARKPKAGQPQLNALRGYREGRRRFVRRDDFEALVEFYEAHKWGEPFPAFPGKGRED